MRLNREIVEEEAESEQKCCVATEKMDGGPVTRKDFGASLLALTAPVVCLERFGLGLRQRGLGSL